MYDTSARSHAKHTNKQTAFLKRAGCQVSGVFVWDRCIGDTSDIHTLEWALCRHGTFTLVTDTTADGTLSIGRRTHTDAQGWGTRVRPGSRRRRGGGDGLRKVGDDVVDVLQAHGHADKVRRDASCGLVGLGQLLVRGRGGVDHQRLGVADVGQVRCQLDRIDKLFRGRETIAESCRGVQTKRPIAAGTVARQSARPGPAPTVPAR